jgi:dGTPase
MTADTKHPGCDESLAPYAVTAANTRGRAHDEPDPAGEDPFEADRRRILHCMAFRRLMHKTQVFVTDCGDHFRTRLTHTLEVVAQAQRLARRLAVNDRLAGAIALAHDLGHAPFGHAGEKALAELMADSGGFEHNLQSLRVVDYLEHPYPTFRGLNLSFELRESLVKHETRYDDPLRGGRLDATAQALAQTGPGAPIEGQIVNLADTIAYTLHDVEDGLVEGLLTEEMLQSCALWRDAAAPVRAACGQAPIHSVRRPVLDHLARRILEDAVAESSARIAAEDVASIDDVRRCRRCLVAFSAPLQAHVKELGGLLFDAVYRHHRVVRMDFKARRLIDHLFAAYLEKPNLMPQRYAERIANQGVQRVICDYIAGMTDRFCQTEHRRLFAPFHFG